MKGERSHATDEQFTIGKCMYYILSITHSHMCRLMRLLCCCRQNCLMLCVYHALLIKFTLNLLICEKFLNW